MFMTILRKLNQRLIMFEIYVHIQMFFSGTACRVLKNVSVKQSTRVHRVNFVQCVKLKHERMIDEVCTNPPEKSRLIVIRPMQNVSITRKMVVIF